MPPVSATVLIKARGISAHLHPPMGYSSGTGSALRTRSPTVRSAPMPRWRMERLFPVHRQRRGTFRPNQRRLHYLLNSCAKNLAVSVWAKVNVTPSSLVWVSSLAAYLEPSANGFSTYPFIHFNGNDGVANEGCAPAWRDRLCGYGTVLDQRLDLLLRVKRC